LEFDQHFTSAHQATSENNDRLKSHLCIFALNPVRPSSYLILVTSKELPIASVTDNVIQTALIRT
jgi:hypothetical protein